MTSKSTRMASIDGVRGILAAYVVLFHACGIAGIPIPRASGEAAVGLFFIMSGYVLTPTWNGDYPAFLVRRFLRLWPVYALCLVGGALLLDVQIGWTDLLFYPLQPGDAAMQIDGAVWSLHVEMWAMLAMPFIVWSGRTISRAILGALAFFALAHFEPRFIDGALFVLGSYLSRYRFNIAMLNGVIPQWLGKISYSLYLTQEVLFHTFAKHFPSVNILLVTPLAFVAGYLVWAVVERYSISLSRWAAAAIKYGSAELTLPCTYGDRIRIP